MRPIGLTLLAALLALSLAAPLAAQGEGSAHRPEPSEAGEFRPRAPAAPYLLAQAAQQAPSPF